MPPILSQIRSRLAKAIAPPSQQKQGGMARSLQPQPYRPYTPYSPKASDLLGQEIGRSGLRYYFPGWIRDERLPELQGRKKYEVFREMGDMNSFAAACLNAFAMFLRRAAWRVDPVDDDNKTNGSAEFLESCMQDMEHAWRTFIAIASRQCPQYGFAPFEIIYKRRDGDKEDNRYTSRFDDGKIGWQDLSIRAPETILHWVWYPDDPTRLQGLVQLAPPDYRPEAFIPIEKLLVLRAEPGENNPEGRSVLRSSYKPYVTIKYAEDIRNVIMERGGSGIPCAKVPTTISEPYKRDAETGEPVLDGEGNPTVDPLALATLQSIITTLTNMRQSEQPWVIIPQQFDENKNSLFDITFLTNNGGSLMGEINNTIHEEGMKILMSTMTEFLALGTNPTGGGSFALSKDKTDNFSQAVTAYLDAFEESINNQAVRRLFKLNPEFANIKILPRIVHEPIIPISINEAIAVLSGLKNQGWDLTKETNAEEIKNAVLDAAGLPKAARKDAPDNSGKPGEATGEAPEQAGPEANSTQKGGPKPEQNQPDTPPGTGAGIVATQQKSAIKKKRCKEGTVKPGSFECPKSGEKAGNKRNGAKDKGAKSPGSDFSHIELKEKLKDNGVDERRDAKGNWASVAHHEYNGILIFSETIASEDRRFSPELIAKCIDDLPPALHKNIKSITANKGPSQYDEANSKRYGFKLTAAGDANYVTQRINLYNSTLSDSDKADIADLGDRQDVDHDAHRTLFPLLAHEAGHLADDGGAISTSDEYKKAIEADKENTIEVRGIDGNPKTIKKGDIFGGMVSEYAAKTFANHEDLGLGEDFADACAEYAKFKAGMDEGYEPLLKNRFAYIEKVLNK
jgi:hypothetical protein